MALATNTQTGKSVVVPDHYIGHPVLGKNLVLRKDEVQAAPKKETKIKEQPAPEVLLVVEPTNDTKENEELEDAN